MCAYLDLLLSHLPVHPNQLYRWRANIHGHMHSKTLDDPRYINVSAEQINLTPIFIEDLRLKLTENRHPNPDAPLCTR